MTIETVLEDLRRGAARPRRATWASASSDCSGAYLTTDPLFAARFSEVWLWQD